jgi:signal recognition particle receptor subunit beta
LELIDIPGHDRVRNGVLMKFTSSLKGLVVLIDSVNFPKEYVDVAAMLYDLFSDKRFMSKRVPILIACNKQDVTLAKDPTFIEEQLANELDRLRTSRGAALEGTSGETAKQVFVGKKGKDFEFSDLPCRVTFVTCSARGSGTDEDSSAAELDDVKDWIHKL